ncbi:MAG: hypothetical protein IID42_03695 [Planctomycetes bacterium]|nr:hypothetical protein [Planctomycetota bacterium]
MAWRPCRVVVVMWFVASCSAAAADSGFIGVDLEQLFGEALADFDQAQQIHHEQPKRARQLFRSAAQRFESLISANVVNGHLEYNLGNCFLQMGEVGRAVLHYRRAETLIPRDPLLRDNLKEARSRCLTPIQIERRSALLHNVFFWHFDTSHHERSVAGLALYAAFWLLLTVRCFIRRRPVAVGALVAAMMALAIAGSLAYDRWAERYGPAGVVTGMDVVVYKGPGPSYQRQFEQPLQSGVEFKLQERRGGWWSVELVDGKTGWIERSAAELVMGNGDSGT